MPWRAATKPAAQNSAAPAPQAMPTAVAVVAAGDEAGWWGTVNPGPFAGADPIARRAARATAIEPRMAGLSRAGSPP